MFIPKNKKLKFIITLLFFIFFLTGVFFANNIFAQTDTLGVDVISEDIALGSGDLRITIIKIINTVLGLLGIIAVVIVLYGGFIYMTAGGEDDKVSKARKIIINGIIGLALILSSWAITKFVLNKLSEATNFQGGNNSSVVDTTVDGDCDTPGTSFYEMYHNTEICNSHDVDYSEQACLGKYFVANSITPSTKSGDVVGMNNLIVRAIFSRPIASNLNNIIKITKDEVDYTGEFSLSLKENNYVLEAKPITNEGCSGSSSDKCLSKGIYKIYLLDVKDSNGNNLQVDTDCGSFPKETSFVVGDENNIIDIVKPNISSVSLNNISGENIRVIEGKEYPINVTVNDRDYAAYGGNSYVVLKIYKEGDSNNIFKKYIVGPSVEEGSSVAFNFNYGLLVKNNFAKNTDYIIDVTTNDIDSNVTNKILKFRVISNTCQNGILDGDETSVDVGGICGNDFGVSCNKQSDCSLSYKCLDSKDLLCSGSNCICKKWPYIEKIEQMDGSAGNWFTITGRNFGNNNGEVYFNYDTNNDGNYEVSTPALLAQCMSNDVWSDNIIIAEVPQLPNNIDVNVVKPVISVRNIDYFNNSPSKDLNNKLLFSDLSNDNFGPNLGKFMYNNIKRPGLCSVTVANSDDVSAAPKAPVSAVGKSFGNSGKLFFASTEAGVNSWADNIVESSVPFVNKGLNSVYIEVAGVKSNSVLFNVVENSANTLPVITSISPVTTTLGSYITINGNNFGSNYGQVLINNKLSAELPIYCGNTWSDKQIIVKVPTDVGLGSLNVVVKNSYNRESNGNNFINVVEGSPKPSICKIEPVKGSAPLLSNQKLTVKGENFSETPIFYFWKKDSSLNNYNTWLKNNNVSNVVVGKELKVSIPYDANTGLSMSTGPILANVNSDFSNFINYEVTDCRLLGNNLPSGFQCCTSGSEAGMMKDKNLVCTGTDRDSGYVWRFTTGKMSERFFVLEQCSQTDYSVTPSPTPWDMRKEGKVACVNSQIQLSFSLPIKSDTVNSQNIKLFSCKGDANNIDCNDKEDVTNQFIIDNGIANTLIFNLKNENSNLNPLTWYRVAISKNLQSIKSVEQFGTTVEKIENLQATRNWSVDNNNFAYYFDFRTGSADTICKLVEARINPAQYTTKLLGIVQDIRWPLTYNLQQIFNISNPNIHPKYFDVYGMSNQECVVLNVSNLPWEWGPTVNTNSQTATAQKNYSSQYSHLKSRAVVTAWENNPFGSDVFAKLSDYNFANVTSTLIATSTIKVELSNPQVVDRWPACMEACVNSEIGVQFNQIMLPNTYNGGVKLYKCSDENCAEHSISTEIPIEISGDENTLRFYSSQNLLPNSWYLVKILDSIYSNGGVVDENVKVGSKVTPINWKFKTKNNSEPCIVENVDIVPDPFFAYYIGQKTPYKAIPRGTVDSCSSLGQVLNPWKYGWDWSVKDNNIANITNFSISGNFNNNFCSLSCLPLGSDIEYKENNNNYSICGNGKIDSGEDCDIAISGEILGVSCTYNCLRPGNTLENGCGNGTVENIKGEECDPKSANVNESSYCSEKCLRIGSSKEITGNTNAPICGSGSITVGEDCDIKDPRSTQGCSSNCLNIGTNLSQKWCDSRNPKSNNDSIACQNAYSVCGNGVVESGEECEINNSNDLNTCDSRCLLKNVCNNTTLKQCNSSDPWCNTDCTLAGASFSYASPSICADGVVGLGESNKCELSLDEGKNILGGSPVQLVTSVGKLPQSNTVTVVDKMSTKIFAKPVMFYDNNSNVTSTKLTNVIGEGDYNMMCGYTEYVEPDEDLYNNCPNNLDNSLGVSSNSCCYFRPTRSAQYPAVNAGIGGTEAVCRNTYLEVNFETKMDKLSFDKNVSVVQGYEKIGQYQNYVCDTTKGQIDITEEMRDYLKLDASIDYEDQISIWQIIWNKLKAFFAWLFNGKVFAEVAEPVNNLNNNIVWCVSPIKIDVDAKYNYEKKLENDSLVDVVKSTDVGLIISEVLDPNVYVVVMLNSGPNGIKDSNGVSIKNPFLKDRNDYWIFKTGNDICKINKIEVTPSSKIFYDPKSNQDFTIDIFSKNGGQLIVSVPDVYEWQYSWYPSQNNIFNIENVDKKTINISSKGVEGEINALAKILVTKDTLDDSQAGKEFSKSFKLKSFFCANPWPSSQTYLNKDSEEVEIASGAFEENKFNFSFLYCADNNNPLKVSDDLPLFDNIVLVDNPEEYGMGDIALRNYLLFSSSTDDAVGIQIFENVATFEGRPRSLEDWYVSKFGSIGDMKQTSISGYSALSNGNNYYVNVFDVDKTQNLFGNIYNYIIQFSINENNDESTSKVFENIINNLNFNTRMTENNKCLLSQYVDPSIIRTDVDHGFSNIDCNTDFDCRDTSGEPLVGTSGFCSNEKTKFYRDLNRLNSLRVSQSNLDKYFVSDSEKNDFVATFNSGSYLNGYTTSKWQNSWGLLNSFAGTVAVDPVNVWAGCEGYDSLTCWNATSSTYACPTYAQVYEYVFVSSTNSYNIYSPFEYLQDSHDLEFVKRYIDTNKIKFGRYCTPGNNLTASAGYCGDGVVNFSNGEQCEPAGSTKLFSYDSSGKMCSESTKAVGTCQINTCTWSIASSCTTNSAKCGNSIKEVGETCDDGIKNGTYGYCNNNCNGFMSYCGDGTKQENEFCEKNDNKYKAGFCELNKSITCTSDVECKSFSTNSSVCEYNNFKKGYRCQGHEDVSCTPANLLNAAKGCEGLTYQVVNVDNGSCLSENDATYDLNKINTCSYDCKSYGGYCGDGITQWSYEACDDGNSNNSDNCKNNCTLNEIPAMTNIPTSDTVSISCGDGKRDFEDNNNNNTKDENEDYFEECDLGSQNGQKCNPEYGKSCTYCSNTCIVETLESTLSCGNGVIDKNDKGDWLESCDFQFDTNGNQTKVFAHDDLESRLALCNSEQKGTYVCSNSCQLLENKCVTCGVASNLPIAQLSVLNPLSSSNYFYNNRLDGTKYFVGLYKLKYAAGKVISGDLMSNIKLDQENKPLYNYFSFSNSSFTDGLETNLLCKDEYKIYFNNTELSSVPDPDQAIDNWVNDRKGDLFDYTVNAETSVVKNDIIMSPALPSGQVRVVVRSNSVKNNGMEFVGNFLYDNIRNINNIKFSSTATTNHCDGVYKASNNYWLPSSSCGKLGDIAYLHKIIKSEKTQIQSYTFDFNNFKFEEIRISDVEKELKDDAIAFYVTSPNAPINTLRNSDLWVDVYLPKETAVPEYSIYKPDYSFYLGNSEISNNTTAPYWHVFNLYVLTNGQVLVAPIGQDIQLLKDRNDNNKFLAPKFDTNYGGAIVTGECQIRQSLPNTQTCEF